MLSQKKKIRDQSTNNQEKSKTKKRKRGLILFEEKKVFELFNITSSHHQHLLITIYLTKLIKPFDTSIKKNFIYHYFIHQQKKIMLMHTTLHIFFFV